ncbi:MAG TPA: hypothetical protein PKX78_01770 [Candidatus Woesebacteria bacterium]|nr:hypothetical protein [Candidatus Woesebacteria bacterium]
MNKLSEKKVLFEQMGSGADRIGRNRTIYDVGWRELVVKNFVAGLSRAVGGLVLNLVFFVIIGSFVFQLFWPQAQATIDSLLQASNKITGFERYIEQQLPFIDQFKFPGIPANPSPTSTLPLDSYR